MNTPPKISVIVPVYNAELFLNKCIDSILNQTFKDFEVLLVNDGSTDGSALICDEYALFDKRIRVFHKENGGVSSARNIGIINMKGLYSIHVDSDDWIDENHLQSMYDFAIEHKCNFLISNYYVNSNKELLVIQKPTQLDRISIVKDLLIGKLHGSSCNKLILNSLIINTGIIYNEKVNYCEDVLFNSKVLIGSDEIKIGYISSATYHYFENNESITQKATFNQVKNLNLYLNDLENCVCKVEELNQAFNIHVILMKYILLDSEIFSSKYIKYFRRSSNIYLSFLGNSLSKIRLWFIIQGMPFISFLLLRLRKIYNFFLK